MYIPCIVLNQIHVYGDKAQSIEDGDRFIAHVKSVEGRKVVVRERATNGSVRGEAL